MNIKFRKAKIDELDHALELFKLASLSLGEKKVNQWNYWSKPPEEKIAWVKEGFENGEFFFVQNENGVKVAMFRLLQNDRLYWDKKGLENNTRYVHSLVVRPSFSGMGIGKAIMQNIIEKIKSEGVKTFRLDCDGSNPKLCAYYESFGFKKVGEKETKYALNNLYEMALGKNNGEHTRPDALIFDMDGTLWDAVETYTLAWNAYFKKHGLSNFLTKSDLDALMGMEEEKFLEKVLPDYTPEDRKSCYKEVIQLQYDMIDQIGGHIYSGVQKYLPLLHKKYPLFIVSNCPKDTIHHFMKFAGIEHLITSSLSHGQNYKPKHENISSLVADYNLKNPRYIGDTQGDMIQSEKAKVPFLFMTYGFGTCDTFEKSFDDFESFALYYLNE